MDANIAWDSGVHEQFQKLLEKVPVFMRGFAQDKVSTKIEALLKQDGRSSVSEKDLVDAFFAETPFGFHGPMKTDMKAIGLDYTKYGHS